MFRIKKVTIAITIVAMLLVGLGFTFSPASAANCKQYYYVKWGDTLAGIGAYFGVPWKELAQVNHIKNPSKIYAGMRLCIPSGYGYGQPYYYPVGGKNYNYNYPYGGYYGDFSFSIVSVSRNKTVTVQTYNFPEDEAFVVKMGPMGTQGKGGYTVDTVDSGDGSVKYTFDIPSELKGEYQIAILMKSKLTGDYASNWFFNNTTGGGGGTGGGYVPSYPKGYYKGYYYRFPTFSILSVSRNNSVTIQTYNLPPNDSFNVTMGPMGTQGIGGYYVDSVNSGSGGSRKYTFSIPSALRGSYQISIRMYSPSSGYFAYNWFYNNTAVDP